MAIHWPRPEALKTALLKDMESHAENLSKARQDVEVSMCWVCMFLYLIEYNEFVY